MPKISKPTVTIPRCYHHVKSKLLLVLAGLLAAAHSHATITVTSPSSNQQIAEGRDYAKYEIGNPWDMADQSDVILYRSSSVLDQQISGGLFTGTSTGGAAVVDPRLWMIHPGPIEGVRRLDLGERFPIDTAIYRKLTMAVRWRTLAGGVPPSAQLVTVLFSPNSEGLAGASNRGVAQRGFIPSGDWQLVEIDLQDDLGVGSAWNSYDLVRGLRLDPTNKPDVEFDIDWVRLSAPATTGERVTVSWNDTLDAAPYSIYAVSASGQRLLLDSGINTTTAQVSFNGLPPGAYDIEVANASESGRAAGAVVINDAPVMNFVNPDVQGDVANRYSVVETGNPWGGAGGAFDAADIESAVDLENLRFIGGDLFAETVNQDGRLFLNTPVPIDTQQYRMLSYEFELTPTENPTGQVSIIRILYGNDKTNMVTTEDIVFFPGVNRHDLGDLRTLPLERDFPQPGTWAGFIDFLRFDPHEIQPPGRDPNRTMRLGSFILAPFDTANPSFAFEWDAFDSDDAASITLYLDPDREPLSGNEILIGSDLPEQNGGGSFNWDSNALADGVYEVFATISDGTNTTQRYATGPLQIGQLQTEFQVVEPDGVGDAVEEAPEFATDRRGNPWDMSDTGDVESSNNVSGASFAGGVYSATATNNDPFVFLQAPGSGMPTISTAQYRYLTAKVRYTGGNPTHGIAVLFYDQPDAAPSNAATVTGGIQLAADQWHIVTIDLTKPTLTGDFDWNDVSNIYGLRLDPTTHPGTRFEIDWVRLVGEPNAASQFNVAWSLSNAPESVFDVFLRDPDGALCQVADDLPPGTTGVQADLTRLPPGNYQVDVVADPGPTESGGPIVVGGIDEGLIFSDGFEG